MLCTITTLMLFQISSQQTHRSLFLVYCSETVHYIKKKKTCPIIRLVEEWLSSMALEKRRGTDWRCSEAVMISHTWHCFLNHSYSISHCALEPKSHLPPHALLKFDIFGIDNQMTYNCCLISEIFRKFKASVFLDAVIFVDMYTHTCKRRESIDYTL